MSPLLLMSVPVVIGTALICVGLLSAIYTLGGIELDRRSENDAAAQISRFRSMISLLDWEESHPAARWLGTLGAGAISVVIAVVLGAGGGALEKFLSFGQAGLTIAFLARGEFFEEIARKLHSAFRNRPADATSGTVSVHEAGDKTREN